IDADLAGGHLKIRRFLHSGEDPVLFSEFLARNSLRAVHRRTNPILAARGVLPRLRIEETDAILPVRKRLLEVIARVRRVRAGVVLIDGKKVSGTGNRLRAAVTPVRGLRTEVTTA